MKIYCVYDTVGKVSRGVFSADNDGLAVRDNALPLSKIYPLGDLEIRQVAEIDDGTLKVEALSSYRVVSWDSYQFPENPIKTPSKTVEKK